MYRILVIEDDPDIRAELKLLLENALYEVDVIEDFTQIVSQAEACTPDLILLDIQLPGINGLSLCQDIRRKMDTPVIFVTSFNNAMDELNGMMMGGDDYITKPYHAPVLLARIAAVLKRTGKKGPQEDPYHFIWKDCELNMLDATLSCR
uniref:response regulator transcription factor n=1 Tax=Eisenbergiella sp. TaxID=1924109 RepID=UPI003AB88C78